MAVTITYDFPRARRLEKGDAAGISIITGTISDTSYATNGTDISPIAAKFEKGLVRLIADSPGGFLTQYVKASNLLKIYRAVDNVAGTRIEVANATDLSTTPGAINFIAIGKM